MIDITKKNLTRGLESTLDKLPISDGKLRFTTDTGRLFLDCGTALRIEISDFVKGMTESQIKSNMIPLPKFYYAYDTQRLFYYNGTTWVQVNNHVEFADKDGVGNNIKDTYAPKNSPSLSGTPTTPTPSSSSSGSMIANKEYVDNVTKSISSDLSKYAPKNSPSLSGTPTTPTPSSSSSGSMIANKEYVDNVTKSISSDLSKYAPKESPTLTGTPTAPTPSSSSSGSMIANKEYVDNIIKNSVGGVTQIEYTVVTSLPTTGEKGKIYFVLNGSTDTTNIYNEYVWINNKFELLGAIQMEFSTDFGDLDE